MAAAVPGPLDHREVLPAAGPALLRCVLVEDQVMFLDLLEAMLSLQSDLQVVASRRTVAEGIQAVEEHRPDLLILDLDLPDGDGTQVAEALQCCHPDARLIVLSGQASTFLCPDALQPMLHAVVDKTNAYRDLQQELAALRPPPPGHPPDPARDPALAIARLTVRERQVLALIGQGLSSKAIATRLGLAADTVHTHRRHITIKMGASGAELVRIAVIHGQLPPIAP
jgi:DNA-binding NarL/FixJ family response regulator